MKLKFTTRHRARRDEIIFSFAGIPARLYKPLKGGGPATANENNQPFRASGITFFSYGLPFVLITASQSDVLFAHRRLPIGKKRKTSETSVPRW
jgi:hypothetical protein